MSGVQVCAQVSLAEESFVTKVTPQLEVDLHVSGELAALGRGVITEAALVGLLAGVGAAVHGQVAQVDEDLATELAGVPPRHHAALRAHARLHRGQRPGGHRAADIATLAWVP